MNEYNTQKDRLILKEYGRNVQLLVEYLKTIEDKEKRNQDAKILVDLMKQINPSIKEGNEDLQKLWDDIIIMSDFTIDIDSPFPLPLKELLYKKPDRLRYKDKGIRFKHYGMNIQLLINYARKLEDKEEQEAAVIYVGRLMKSFASIWNQDNLDDQVIIDNIKKLSHGELTIDIEKVKEGNLFTNLVKDKPRSYSNSNSTGGRDSKHKRTRRKRF